MAVRALLTPLEAAFHATAAAALTASFVLDPAWVANQPTVCPVRLITGLPCPGCGLTRSCVALAHGDASAAVAFHPFGPVAFAALWVVVLVKLGELIAGRRVPARAVRGALYAMVPLACVWLGWALHRLAGAAGW